jgi:hypothetical protein
MYIHTDLIKHKVYHVLVLNLFIIRVSRSGQKRQGTRVASPANSINIYIPAVFSSTDPYCHLLARGAHRRVLFQSSRSHASHDRHGLAVATGGAGTGELAWVAAAE